tara:strand:+ start:8690 stop:9223 length:534 start_codon:yes stop_codon:yes gene_type:complete
MPPAQKLKSGPRTNHEKRNHLIEKVAEWHATPEKYREQKSIHALAKSLGMTPNEQFYKLADSAEVYHRCLVKAAGDAIGRAPAILDVLGDKAIQGNNRSAEIFLDFVRKTITDEGILSKLQPSVDVGEVMHSVEKATSNLLELANTLKDRPVFSEIEDAVMADDDPEEEVSDKDSSS